MILHTGLGRARLAPEAARALQEVAESHSTLELDVASGKRGDRQDHVRSLLIELTGAEDALVVNNAAAAVFLALHGLAFGREVVLSRGQMVEIGGSFRLPDVVRESGCRLVEVGCTNKTRLSDYEGAFTEETAAVLRCHPSNFKVVGFSEEPEAPDMADLCRRKGAIFLDDVGSGCLVDLSKFGLPRQPTIQDSVKAGADVVMASGDKLLGGPQAGLLLGKSEYISALSKHPIARVVRADKLALAALEATLRLYASGRELEIPTLRYISRPSEEIKKMAKRIAKSYSGVSVVEAGGTEVGGGSLPGVEIPTFRAGLEAKDIERLSSAMRAGSPPIIGRIENGRFWMDPRTLEDFELRMVEQRLRSLG